MIEDDIRQRVGLYDLYADGDGPGGRPRDMRALAKVLIAPDVVSEIDPADGSAPHLNGRDISANARARSIRSGRYASPGGTITSTPSSTCHRTTAKTRTTAVFFDATKNLVGPKCEPAANVVCGGTQVRTIIRVCQMTWRETADGGQIERNILRAYR